MKKLLLSLALSVVSLAFGQEETVKFSKKLVYKMDTANSNKTNTLKKIESINYYHSDNYGVVGFESQEEIEQLHYNNVYGLFGRDRMFWLSVSADDRRGYVLGEEVINKDEYKFDFSKINKKGKFGGVSCNYYKVDYKEKISVEVCVDEASKINNLKNVFGGNVSGKILSISIEERGYKVATLNLVEENNTDFFIKLDNASIEKAIVKQKRRQALIDSTNKASDKAESFETAPIILDPLYYPYTAKSYTNNREYILGKYLLINSIINVYEGESVDAGNRKNQIAYIKANYKSTLKNALKTKQITKEEHKNFKKFFEEYIKEVEAFDPKKTPEKEPIKEENVDIIKEKNGVKAKFPAYKTEYKTMYMDEEPSLAVTGAIKNEELKKSIPQFCSNIEERISVFENKELKKQMWHFLGQTCDLYLHPKVDNVYYEGTIDALRRSILEIEKIRPNLSRKDKKNLSEIIENLD